MEETVCVYKTLKSNIKNLAGILNKIILHSVSNSVMLYVIQF